MYSTFLAFVELFVSVILTKVTVPVVHKHRKGIHPLGFVDENIAKLWCLGLA